MQRRAVIDKAVRLRSRRSILSDCNIMLRSELAAYGTEFSILDACYAERASRATTAHRDVWGIAKWQHRQSRPCRCGYGQEQHATKLYARTVALFVTRSNIQIYLFGRALPVKLESQPRV